MSNTYRQRATELLQRAAAERHSGRKKYLSGLAASYEALAGLRGEVEPSAPSAMAPADRRTAAVLLRGQGLTWPQIAERLGCSQQRVGQILREAALTNGGRPNGGG